MRHYWICEDCASENLYPDIRICETCGMEMTQAAEQRVLKDIKEEERRREQLKKEQERCRKEELRKKREAEIKRHQEQLAAQQAEREKRKIAELERILRKKKEREQKFGNFIRKTTNYSRFAIKTSLIVVIIISTVILFKNFKKINFEEAFLNISQNAQTEYYAHTVVDNSINEQPEVTETSSAQSENTQGASTEAVYGTETEMSKETRILRSIKKFSDSFGPITSDVSSKIKNQSAYITSTFHPIDNTAKLISDIVEYISGGE